MHKKKMSIPKPNLEIRSLDYNIYKLLFPFYY
jgi:hypothetical protein